MRSARQAAADPRTLARRVVFTLLLAAVAIVSAIGIFESARRAFSEELDLVRGFLLAVTLVAASIALVRGLRFYASRSLLAPLIDDSRGSSPQRSPLWQRMPAAMDDVTWIALAGAVFVLNLLAVLAAVAAVAELFGDGEEPLAWLIWQVLMLVVALVFLTRLSIAAAKELRDRSRRRRRGFVQVLTRKLIYWPGGSGGRRGAAVAAAAIPCLLAAMAWGNVSGPLLEQPNVEKPSGGGGVGGTSWEGGATPPPAAAETSAAGSAEADRRRDRAERGRRNRPRIARSPARERVAGAPPPAAETSPPLASEPPPAAEPASPAAAPPPPAPPGAAPQAGPPAQSPPPRLSSQAIVQGGEAPPEAAPPPEATTPPEATAPPEAAECAPPATGSPAPGASPPPQSNGEPAAPAAPPGQPCPPGSGTSP